MQYSSEADQPVGATPTGEAVPKHRGAPHLTPSPKARLYELDALRFAAALMVLLVHYTWSGSHTGGTIVDFSQSLGPATRYGYLGVDLFFMISGLVVLMSTWNRTPSQFLISRISRLYPAYWVAVSLTTVVVITGVAQGRDGITPLQYLANMAMLAAPLDVGYIESVYWTLWAEWRFYALLFLFAIAGITIRRAQLFMWGWLSASVAVEFLPIPGEHSIGLLVQPQYSHYFIAGMAMYLVYRFGLSVQLGLLIFCTYLAALYHAVQRVIEPGATEIFFAHLNPTIILLAVSVMYAVMLLISTRSLSRWSHPFLAQLGSLTYPLYLIHATIGYALFNALAAHINPWVLLPAITGAMCALSWMISTQVEARLQPRIRRNLTAAWNTVRDLSRRKPMHHSSRPNPKHSVSLHSGIRPEPETPMNREDRHAADPLDSQQHEHVQ